MQQRCQEAGDFEASKKTLSSPLASPRLSPYVLLKCLSVRWFECSDIGPNPSGWLGGFVFLRLLINRVYTS